MEFLCNGLRPIIDGKIKPDHLKMLLEIELEAMEEEHERPVSVLTKAADAMPGFGIVAAVLGIVIDHVAPFPGRWRRSAKRWGRGAGGNLSGHFPFLRLHESAGGEHRVYESFRDGLHPVHCRLGHWFCRRDVAHHGGGSGPARAAQRSQTQRGRAGDDVEGVEPGAAAK